jgi:hypothetical protein
LNLNEQLLLVSAGEAKMEVSGKLTIGTVRLATKPVVTLSGYCVEVVGTPAFPQMSEANSCPPVLPLGGRTKISFVKQALGGLGGHIGAVLEPI